MHYTSISEAHYFAPTLESSQESTMKLPFSHKEDIYFTLLRQSSENIAATASALVDLMENYENVPDKVTAISNLEHVGDDIIHTIMNRLHNTFVTPLDKEDIALLGQRMDDVVDNIEEAALHMLEYRIEQPTSYAVELAHIILQCSRALEPCMGFLQYQNAKLRDILPVKDKLNLLEDEADQITSKAMSELFVSYGAMDIIKWKDIYSQLEGATDRFEDIASILDGIVVKYIQ
jgi:predicted phosphate transport protein (TIGR00153 family)